MVNYSHTLENGGEVMDTAPLFDKRIIPTGYYVDNVQCNWENDRLLLNVTIRPKINHINAYLDQNEQDVVN